MPDLTSDRRLYVNHLEDDGTKVRVLLPGHHEAHKLLCVAGGTIPEKLVKKLKLTPDMLKNAESPAAAEVLEKLRNKSLNPGVNLAKR
jgi:hypothetical protein